MATYGNGIKYSALATSGGTVPANSFAVVTYTATSNSAAASNATSGWVGFNPVTIRLFGAGATVPATFTAQGGASYTSASATPTSNVTVTYTFASGVILANS